MPRERWFVTILHEAALAVLVQARVCVRIDTSLAGVAVVDLVVPGDPESRRDDKRKESDPSDHVSQRSIAHDGAVQGLMTKKRQACQAMPDHRHQQQRDGPRAPPRNNRHRGRRDYRHVDRQPRQTRMRGFECAGREVSFELCA